LRIPLPQALMLLLAKSMAAALLIWQPPAVAMDEPTVDCVITPYLTVDVSSATPGVIDNVYVERGDQVEQNQVVAVLDSEVEKAAVDIATARSTMVSEVMLGIVNMDYDKLKQQRLSSLHVRDVVSTQDKDEAERNAKAAKLKLQHARDLQRLRQLELRKAEEELQQRSVRSPIQGVVVQRFKYSAEYVEDQPIVRVAQLDPLNIEAIVPMEMFGRIQEGMGADVFPDIVSDEARQATVTVVDKMGDAASGTFGVRMTMPNPGNALPAGVKCHARFDLNSPVRKPATYRGISRPVARTIASQNDEGMTASPGNTQNNQPAETLQQTEMRPERLIKLASASEIVTPQALSSSETTRNSAVMQLAMLDSLETPTQTDAVEDDEKTGKTTEGKQPVDRETANIASGQYDSDLDTMPKIWLKRPVVNVRAAPNQKGEIIRKANQSDAIYKVEEVRGWFKVYLPEKGTVGYMAGFLLGEMTDAWQP